MKTSPARNQRMIDDAAEIEGLAEKLAKKMTEALTRNEAFEVVTPLEHLVYDRDNVVDAMIDIDQELFNWAVVSLASDSAEAMAEIFDLKSQAIEQVVAGAELLAMAKDQFYKMDEAA